MAEEKKATTMNFTEDLLKPALDLPLQVLGIATTALPIPGFRNISEDALQWANPAAYDRQKILQSRLSIAHIGTQINIWTWIALLSVAFLYLRKTGKNVVYQ